jgi:hypothetical protein
MVAATMQAPGRKQKPFREMRRSARVDVIRAAYETVANHGHFRGRAHRFQFVQQDDRLIVRGCVPSFYLKQVLQTALMDVDGVRLVDNQVDVVASDGLSSVRDE